MKKHLMILCSYILQRNSSWIIVGPTKWADNWKIPQYIYNLCTIKYLLITSSALFSCLFLQSIGTGTALFENKSPKFILFFRFLAHYVLVNKEWKEAKEDGGWSYIRPSIFFQDINFEWFFYRHDSSVYGEC